MPDITLWIASLTLALTSIGLMINQNWRWNLGLFALQYFAVFWLVFQNWPLSMSATLLVTGWMAIAVLGMTKVNITENTHTENSWPQGRIFRLLSAGLVILTISALFNTISTWFPKSPQAITWGALILISMGLLHLGMTLQPLSVISGLLTTLSGFEILYTLVENSVLVAGLLAVVTMGLAILGCYLLLLGEKNR